MGQSFFTRTMYSPNRMRAAWVMIAAWLFANPVLAQEKACLEKIHPLEKQKLEVSQWGGLWTLFEQARSLREHSVVAIQLDSRINTILFHLKHLCKTLHGVPLNDLAQYVSKNLEKKGEKNFRRELRVLGKSQAEIDIWIKFTRFANEHKNRPLDEQSVYATIAEAQPFIQAYVNFSHKVRTTPRENQADQAGRMIEEVDTFLKTNANMAQALYEKAQVPFWDIDENHGGS